MYDTNGQLLMEEFEATQQEDYVNAYSYHPSIIPLSNNNFIVSYDINDSNKIIKVYGYDNNNNQLQENAQIVMDSFFDISSLKNGNFAISYVKNGLDSARNDKSFMAIYDGSGNLIKEDIEIGNGRSKLVTLQSGQLAALRFGEVTESSKALNNLDPLRVYVQIFSEEGIKQGNEFKTNIIESPVILYYLSSVESMTKNNSFIFTWNSENRVENYYSPMGKIFKADSSGKVVSENEFQIFDNTKWQHKTTSITPMPDGGIVASIGANDDIYAKLFDSDMNEVDLEQAPNLTHKAPISPIIGGIAVMALLTMKSIKNIRSLRGRRVAAVQVELEPPLPDQAEDIEMEEGQVLLNERDDELAGEGEDERKEVNSQFPSPSPYPSGSPDSKGNDRSH